MLITFLILILNTASYPCIKNNSPKKTLAVKNGIVTLAGTVDAYSKRIAAEKAAQNVKGVMAVALDIVVNLFSFGKKNDSEIAEAVLNALKWYSAVQEEKIQIKVEHGIVTLDGNADWEYQRKGAEKAIRNLVGVIGIINLINVAPKLTAQYLKKKISVAFHRHAAIDADRIIVEPLGSKVVLKGKVRSWAKKRDAENAA